MEIKSSLNGDVLNVELSGELNALTSPELMTFLAPHIQKIKSLVFDFKECDFVSSAGIRVLLSSFKTLKKNLGDMRLENVGPNFKEVLEATGLDVAFGIL